jgi:hypothetical protein
VLGFLDPQPHYATFPIEFALGYLPVQTQSQQFMKQLFGCPASYLPPLSTENSEEPFFDVDLVLYGQEAFDCGGVISCGL